MLKYEPHHDSALAQFLLSRALKNREEIGHLLFWNLKAELHVPEIQERYVLLLEAYVRGCGALCRAELAKSLGVVDRLTTVAQRIKVKKKKKKKIELGNFFFFF